MPASSWTEDRVSRLKTLWLEGRTADQIARDLQNGITRSAVLGKVYRLGLSAGRPGRSATPKSPVGLRPNIQRLRSPSPKATPPGPAWEGTEDECPPSGGVSILTVGRDQCRWPYGDPSRAGFSLCGRRIARGAFCESHAAVGYRTPPGDPLSLLALAALT